MGPIYFGTGRTGGKLGAETLGTERGKGQLKNPQLAIKNM